LSFHPIATYPACLILPKGHALARRARADIRSLLNEKTISRYPLIVHEVQREGLLKDTLSRLKLPLNTGLEVGTIDTLKHYVARGLGIAVVSELCVSEEDRARLEIVPFPAELSAETTYGVVLRHNKHRSAPLRSLLGILSAITAQPIKQAR
jgi:DNA-binding transcriptional LysR family regulator